VAGAVHALGRLAGDLSHDLTDLLTAITGNTDLLIASLDPAGASILDAYEIRRAALSAAQLIKPLRARSASPAMSGGQVPMAIPRAPEGEPAPAPPRLATVLVVEDEPGLRELIRVVLGRAGYEVLTAAGPRAALALLGRQPAIALLLVDVVMPEMDGYDFVADARRLRQDVPVVFMSAFSVNPARQSSADAFIQKPFSPDSLAAIVRTALAGGAGTSDG